MTKEQLIALGMSSEMADKVVSGFSETHISKVKATEIEEELKQIKTEIKERDKQLEDLKKNTGDNEALKKQIADLQKDNTEKETAYKIELDNFKKNSAIEMALVQNKAKNNKALKALLFLDDIKLKENGELEGLEKQLEVLKTSDAYLFESKETVPNGFNPANPNNPTGANTPLNLGEAIAQSLIK